MEQGAPRRRQGDDPVYRITGAARSHSDDMSERVVRYSISMSVRVLCLVLAFVVDGPLRWVFVAGAVVLPYVAVVMANTGRRAPDGSPATLTITGGDAAITDRPHP